MTVRGQILSEAGEPLENASVTLVNAKGDFLGQGVAADNAGKFALTSPNLSGNYLLITYSGMEPLMIEPATLAGSNYAVIEMFAKLLDPVTVTPGTPGGWYLLLIGGLVLYGISRRRKKLSYG